MLLAASVVFTYYTTWAILLVSQVAKSTHLTPTCFCSFFPCSHSLTLQVKSTTSSQPVNGQSDSPPSSSSWDSQSLAYSSAKPSQRRTRKRQKRHGYGRHETRAFLVYLSPRACSPHLRTVILRVQLDILPIQPINCRFLLYIGFPIPYRPYWFALRLQQSQFFGGNEILCCLVYQRLQWHFWMCFRQSFYCSVELLQVSMSRSPCWV